MRIYSEDCEFYPENFRILKFYVDTLLFAWHGEKLKVFPYGDGDVGSKPRTLLAPGEVLNVQSYDDRIFITCKSHGIHKLSKNYQFVQLSSSGIGIGAKFYQVLTVKDDYVCLVNKQAKTLRSLLKYDPIDGAVPSAIGLIADNVDDELLTVLLEGAVDQTELCIFSTGYEIYKITSDAVKIIHSSNCPISGIVEVKKSGKLACLLYITNKNTAILMHAEGGDLVFEKIHVNHRVKTAYAYVDEISRNIVWMIHSDGVNTYKSKKILGKHSVISTELTERNITCLSNYNSEVLGLRSTGELVRLDLSVETLVDSGDDDFVKMKLEMLEGTDSIIESICDRVEELQSLDIQLIDLQSALKRINIAACKQAISTAPKLNANKTADGTIISCKFGYIPEQTKLSFSLKSAGRKIFSTKRVTEDGGSVELTVPTSVLSESADITVDLITLADADYSWCILKNCTKDIDDGKVRKRTSTDDRNSFVDSKLAALKNLKIKDKLDIEKLDAIKSRTRKEFNCI